MYFFSVSNFHNCFKKTVFLLSLHLFITATTVSNVLFTYFLYKVYFTVNFLFILLFSMERHKNVDFLMQILDMHIISLFNFKTPSIQVEYRH